MREKAVRAGVRLRPHVKTHKTIEGARLQLGGKTGPITVSTLAEAEFFADQEFRDITYAVPVSPSKLDRAAALSRRIDSLNLLIDHESAFVALEDYGRANGLRWDVFLKVDCGYHRAGVDPEADESVRLAARIAGSELARFKGLLTHAGHSYAAASRDEVSRIAKDEIEVTGRFRERLVSSGVEVPTVSVGSTPTMSVVGSLEGADEIRPGNYIFYDAFQAAIGSCDIADIGVSVLTSVIGVYPARGLMIVDAGALALSKDRGRERPDGFDYGLVCDLAGSPIDGAHLASLSQEHGEIETDEAITGRFRIGDRVRILPNHSCLAAALFDRYYLIEQGEVVGQWIPIRGW